MAIPLAYLITFSCYGSRLHGDERGSVDRDHRATGSPPLPPNPRRVTSERQRMKDSEFDLNDTRRIVVLKAIHTLCDIRGWTLYAAHVRTQHVHLVIGADAIAGRVLHDVKSYSTRALDQHQKVEPRRRCWTRHGSTKYLWKPEQITAAINYVVREQGDPMAVYESEPRQ